MGLLRTPPFLTPDGRRKLQQVARREVAPELVVRGATIANVYSGEWMRANVEVAAGRIAYVGPREPVNGPELTVIDADSRFIVPGYVEPHAHPWVLYNPVSLLESAVPSGTTTLVFDNLFFFLQTGVPGMRRLIDAVAGAPAHLFWVARLATETTDPNVAAAFTEEAVEEMLGWPEVVATGEVGRWLRVASGELGILNGMDAARRAGKRADGHSSGASYERLVALVLAGLSADHEAIDGQEMLARLRLGLWTMLRHSSLRPDLGELLQPIRQHGIDTRRLMLTTDGSAPVHYSTNRFIDGMLGAAVSHGLDPMTAIQMATINPATFLGLDEDLGGVAPGRRGTFLILRSADHFTPETVVVDGRVVARDGRLEVPLPRVDWDGLGFRQSFAEPAVFARPDLYVPGADGHRAVVPVMAFESAVITRRQDRSFAVRRSTVDLSGHDDCAYAALIDRDGRWVSTGIAAGLLPTLPGLASTYNASQHVLALGRDPLSMMAAAQAVAEAGGGLAAAEHGRVTWAAPLPIAGIMTDGLFEEALRIEKELLAIARRGGYRFHDILYTLLFFVCDFLPDLRLTPSGLLEVKSGRILQPRRMLLPTVR